jgi:hypothetical protein
MACRVGFHPHEVGYLADLVLILPRHDFAQKCKFVESVFAVHEVVSICADFCYSTRWEFQPAI